MAGIGVESDNGADSVMVSLSLASLEVAPDDQDLAAGTSVWPAHGTSSFSRRHANPGVLPRYPDGPNR
jgi:hypothetical protein